MDSKLLIFLCCIGVQFVAGEDILTSPMVTNWGEWGPFQRCPQGTKVIGFQLKTDPWDAWDIVIDDTCLNGIKFYCGIPSTSGPGTPVDTITSSEGNWGKWGNIFWCDGLGFARGFMLRSVEETTANVDESATNNMRVLCSEGTAFIDGDGERWGEWTAPRICGTDQYICGLQTQIEAPQGISIDDTSLNNVRVVCCDMTSEELLTYGKCQIQLIIILALVKVMTKRKSSPVETTLTIPALEDRHCMRFCFESCRLYDETLRNVCIAAQRECDCIRKEINFKNRHEFLTSHPSPQKCIQYCREGTCQKYFTLDSSLFSECIGAILLCSCNQILQLESNIPELVGKKYNDDDTYSSTSWLIILLTLIISLFSFAVICVLFRFWRNNRIGNVNEELGEGRNEVNPSSIGPERSCEFSQDKLDDITNTIDMNKNLHQSHNDLSVIFVSNTTEFETMSPST